MKVFTYFEECGVNRDSGWMLNTWSERWRDHGYTPVVLTERDARRHPRFTWWDSFFRTLPSVNAPRYELCCFLRWLPMSLTGGIMVDYDLFPVDFPPSEAETILGGSTITFGDRNRVPCVVIGRAAGFALALQWFKDYQMDVDDHVNSRPHISDMMITTRHREAHTLDIVKEYGENKDAKLIHFPNDACGGNKRRAVERYFGI